MSKPFLLRKMSHEGSSNLSYTLGPYPISESVGKHISLACTGRKECIECGREIKKTFQQGYCFPCVQRLAKCDICIVRPEKCHYHEGTCREPEWGESHCLIDHVVYLANTTGLKVGITKAHKTHERWGDQGALAAVLLARVPDRLVSGNLEVALKEHVDDKSNWRALIKGEVKEIDLLAERRRLLQYIPAEFEPFILPEKEVEVTQFHYPVQKYPSKASTINLDKTPEVTGILEGIRGQYLFIGEKALNIRKYAGYEVVYEL